MAGDIEFLPEEFDDGAPLPEPEPPRRSVPLHRALRWGALAIIAAIAVTWVLTRPGTGGPATGAGAPVATRTVAPSVSPAPVATFAPDAMVTCGLGTPVADEVTAAMHRYLPGIVVDNLNSYRCVRTVRAFDRIVFEAVRGHYHRLDVVIELTARAARGEVPLPEFHESDLGGAGLPTVRTIQTEGAALLVRIAVSGPRHAPAPSEALTTALSGLADFLTLNIYL
jgi:hypothetical protein